MGDIKEKFKGYSIAAWIVLIGGALVFSYGVKEIILESYENWVFPVGAILLGFVIMRYPSLLASVFKKKTGIEDDTK